MGSDLEHLLGEIRSCRICRDTPNNRALPHEPRPVVRAQSTARIAVCGQAPGTRVHASGFPFTDPSGDRLRAWMSVTPEEFYDEERVAVVPMGFCFPGLDAKGGDLPPRKECAPAWRARVFAHLPNVKIILLVGGYAQKWHLGARCPKTLTETVERWREFANVSEGPSLIPLPHPSWRNNAWIKRHPWFEAELLPVLRRTVRKHLDDARE